MDDIMKVWKLYKQGKVSEDEIDTLLALAEKISAMR